MRVEDDNRGPSLGSMPWARARQVAHQAGARFRLAARSTPLPECDGSILAEDLVALTDLPAFPTCSVDGWAVRGDPPWRIVGRILAGGVAPPLAEDGVCVEIATGAMVPAGTQAVVRVEDSTVVEGRVAGVPRADPEWRESGEEARRGEVLLRAGATVTPSVLGLAAACGHDRLPVINRPRAEMLVFGDELLTSGLPAAGRIRDSLGPQIPAWLARLGCDVVAVRGPVADTLDGHVVALRASLDRGVELIVTTGGTMRGPVDHLHPALAKLGAEYVVNTVKARPGFPMLLAAIERDGGATLLAGLPGNPQSAVIALMSLVAPALAGLRGQPLPELPEVVLAAPVAGRGAHTHLALVRRGADGAVTPVRHVGSAMLRGLSQAVGFAVIAPGGEGRPGDRVALLPLPLLPGELRA